MSNWNQTYLKTKKLSVGYQGIPLIENIEFALSKGEIITLIGPNGAGKSTILKSITKQLKLIAGEIQLDQNSIMNQSEKELAKKMAIVFTEHLSPELMTVYEVVALGRYPYTNGIGHLKLQDQEKIGEAMKLVQITELAEKEFAHLSDGQKQRVLLARAICQEPDILILDEPTSYLDVKYKLEFFSVLQKMTRKKQIGVLMSLHELDLAERVSDKILCIGGKRIERYGTPEEIFQGDFLKNMYRIECGSLFAENGSMELEKVKGKSEVFVIAGNHTGAFVYRELQRKGIPFSTGILAENDLDYPPAKALANQVISVPAYEEITENAYKKAKEELSHCRELICCQKKFGPLNRWNETLLEEARKMGISICQK